MKNLLLLFMIAAGMWCPADTVRFAVLSDIHVMPGNANEALLQQAIREINAGDAELVFVTGDLTNRGTEKELRRVHELLSAIEKPMYAIPGNHETNWSDNAALLFGRLWGGERFVFEHGGHLFLGASTGPYLKMGDGFVRAEDMAFLRDSLARMAADGKPVLLFLHYPLADELSNGEEVAELLRPYNVRAIICGHTHVQCMRNIYGVEHVVCRQLNDRETAGYNLVASDGVAPVVALEKRIGGGILGLERREPIGVSLLPPPNPLPEGVNVELLHESDASIFTGLAVTPDTLWYGTADGRITVLDRVGKVRWSRKFGEAVYATPAARGNAVLASVVDLVEERPVTRLLLFNSPGEADPQVLIEPSPELQSPGVLGDAFFLATAGRLLKIGTGLPQGISRPIAANNPQARPAFGEGLIVFGAWDGHLYAYGADDLTLRWRWHNGRPGQTLLSPGNVTPVAGRGQVVTVAPDRYMTALCAETGEQMWRTNARRFRESLGAGPDRAAAYAKTMDGFLVAVALGESEYRELWSCDLGFGYDHAPCPVYSDGTTVYAGSKNGVIAAVDAASGRLLWRYRGGNTAVNEFNPGPDGEIYATLIEGRIYRITHSTGTGNRD